MKIDVKPNSVAILGYHDGNAGQIETWFEKYTPYHIACFVHEAESFYVDVEAENKKRVSQRTSYPVDGILKGKPFLVCLNWIDELKKLGINKVLPINPNNKERYQQIKKCLENDIELVSAIHPSVHILEDAIIHNGVWINAGSLIGYKTEIESGVIINTRAQLDHHNVLKCCSQINPGVITAGYVTLHERANVYTGAVIINRIEIGEDAIVGAGAVVIKDVPPRCTVVGVPARVTRRDGNRIQDL